MARIAVIAGDGIGKEVIPAAQRVMEIVAKRFDIPMTFKAYPLGADHYLETGEAMPEDVFQELRDETDAIFLGALGDPRIPDSAHARDILLGLRRRLDLYINFRPTKLIHPRYCPLKINSVKDVDMVIFRENTQGLYSGAGGSVHHGTDEEISTEVMIYSYRGVERILRAAFEYANERNLRLCMVDKSNALRNVGALWMRVFQDFKALYPQVEARHLYVDIAAMQMVQDPSQFDVIVTSNLFGDILSDLAAVLQGGMGMASSANLHPGKVGLFEPVHGSAPDIAGKGIANPVASLLTAVQMFEQLGYPEAAAALHKAIADALEANETTPDMGGTLSTEEVASAVAARLA